MALGGMVGKSILIKESFLDSCFEIIKNSSNPDIKIHAFGMTSFNLLSQYPITSADSSSYIMTAINGGVMTDRGVIDVSQQKSNNLNHYIHLDKNYIDSFNDFLKEYEVTLDELSESCNKRIITNAKYMQKKIVNIQYKPKQKCYKLF